MFHPMTGKPTKQKVHWYYSHHQSPWGVTVELACSVRTTNPIYCDDINDITCLKCMDIATRPVKPSELEP